MIKEIQLTDRIGEVVTQYPNTAEVFKEFRIDFCCGGNKTILQVIGDQGIDEQKLFKRLREAATSVEHVTQNWTELSSSELIDHIVQTHHAYTKKILPELNTYATKIASVHGPHHPELIEVKQCFAALKKEMEQHMVKEEGEDFQAMLDYEADPSEEKREKVLSIKNALEEEHEGAGKLLLRIREITNDFELPEDACTTYRLTFTKMEELEADLFQHIHLENNILFARI